MTESAQDFWVNTRHCKHGYTSLSWTSSGQSDLTGGKKVAHRSDHATDRRRQPRVMRGRGRAHDIPPSVSVRPPGTHDRHWPPSPSLPALPVITQECAGKKIPGKKAWVAKKGRTLPLSPSSRGGRLHEGGRAVKVMLRSREGFFKCQRRTKDDPSFIGLIRVYGDAVPSSCPRGR